MDLVIFPKLFVADELELFSLLPVTLAVGWSHLGVTGMCPFELNWLSLESDKHLRSDCCSILGTLSARLHSFEMIVEDEVASLVQLPM